LIGNRYMRRRIILIGILIVVINFLIIPIAFGFNNINSESINIKNSNFKEDFNDHIWSMYKHDAQHTSLSSYDTSDNPGYEKWAFFMDYGSDSSIVIDKDGTIYTVTGGEGLISLFPDGTLKWKQKLLTPYPVELALAQDGTIFVSTTREFYAYYPNGTLKWTLDVGGEKMFTGYPTIDSNGTIFVGTSDGYLFAINPDGTIKWNYFINANVRTSSVDNKGNIYFTSRNKRVYCLNSNGTLKWKSSEISIFDDCPIIDDDGTIYLAPRTDWLYAYYPNGTEKWRVDLPDSEGIPSIAPNGNIIIAGKHYYIMALDPSDGNILWKYHVEDNYEWMTTSAIGADGTIFFAYTGYSDRKGHMCALNPDGSLKWETEFIGDIQPYSSLNTNGAPVIGSDGTVYVVSWFLREGQPSIYGYVHAFGELDADAPSAPNIKGPTNGIIGTDYDYIFNSESPVGRDVYYLIDWGDDSVERWIGPFSSGEEIVISHNWEKRGRYTIKARTKDTDNLWGPWSEHQITIPRTRDVSYNWLLDYFPFLERLLTLLR
jgi:hypothetical protein